MRWEWGCLLPGLLPICIRTSSFSVSHSSLFMANIGKTTFHLWKGSTVYRSFAHGAIPLNNIESICRFKHNSPRIWMDVFPQGDMHWSGCMYNKAKLSYPLFRWVVRTISLHKPIISKLHLKLDCFRHSNKLCVVWMIEKPVAAV